MGMAEPNGELDFVPQLPEALHPHGTSPALEPGPIAPIEVSGAIHRPRVFARGSRGWGGIRMAGMAEPNRGAGYPARLKAP